MNKWLYWMGHSTAFFGACMVMFFTSLGAYGLYEAGAFGLLVTTIKRAIPEPPPVPPVTVSIRGPQPRQVLEGVSTILVADTTGPAGDPQWSVIPSAAGSLHPATGRVVDFTPHLDGPVVIHVVVGGANNQVAQAQVEVEALTQVVQEPEPAPAPPAPAPTPAPQPPPQPMPPPQRTVADVIAELLAGVNSPDRVTEAHAVASAVSSVVGMINAGTIPPSANVGAMVEDAGVTVLGKSAASWHGFFAGVSAILDTMRAQGDVSTAVTTVPVLLEVQGVLANAR